uniref:DUF202 domain-containing protein n=1 Tax=Rhizochromulina marina TaxID=1034831 RepID=A0A7S2S6X6_9STRA|mmetsp:Transcript_25991/g.75803  ORF Transcript_25991/g.75803 Transcript_25991/m.75803 type:complete len:232 (+) Transcript_25991:211-906(+)
MASCRIRVRLGDGQPFQSVAWFQGTSDDAIREVIASGLGLSRAAEFVLEDASGFLVPCCNQLPGGSEYTIRLLPLAVPSSAAQSKDLARTPPTDAPAPRVQQLDGDHKQAAASLSKFERMSSHLANERTFLAWVRTAVAVAGLAVTFSELFSHPSRFPVMFWGGSVVCWAIGLATFVVGILRYRTVKLVLNKPREQITNRFGRTGMAYMIFGFGTFLVIMSAAYIAKLKYD